MNVKFLRFPVKLMFVVCILCIRFSANAQTVNYKVLKDTPNDVNNLWVYLDLAQMDFGIKNIGGASFNTGIWSTATFKERLGGDFIFRYAWITFGKLGGSGINGVKLKSHTQFELGGFYFLKKSTRVSNTNVILSQKSYTSGDKKITETRSIKIPATKNIALGVRGGIIHYGSPYDMDKIKKDQSSISGFPDRINYSMTGIYAGVLSVKTHNVVINTDTDGMVAKARRSRLYLDALIFPVSSAKLNGVDYKKQVNPGVLGFRLGWQVMPSELRKLKGIDAKTTGMSIGVEAGMRPFDGLYVTGTWSICLLRKKLPSLGYQAPASEQNTSE